jgi:hypothetical protein
MKSSSRRQSAVSASIAGAIFALFALALIVFDPLPAPAAVFVLDVDATPTAEELAIEPEPTAEPCAAATETPTPEPSVTELLDDATPVAVEEPAVEIAEETCISIEDGTVPPTVEAEILVPIEPEMAATETAPAPEETVESSTATATSELVDPTLSGLPIEVTPTAEVIDPSLSGLPIEVTPTAEVIDPSLSGLPIEVTPTAEVIDPAIAGIPEVAAANPDATGDPMLSGVSTDGVTSQETGAPADPMLAGAAEQPVASTGETTIADPMLSGVTTAEVANPVDDPAILGAAEVQAAALPNPFARVDIDVLSPDGTVVAGGSISYRFEVSNPRIFPVTFSLYTTTDRSGWTAVVYRVGSSTPLTGEITLWGWDDMEVVVVVKAPNNARVGDRATTALEADIDYF